jgi:8-hydroxy-5-deazaflavin:NADPH oxidoreductase
LDSASAKARVMELVDQAGFDAVDAGGIDESWRQQPGTPVYTADLGAERVRTALAEAKPDQTRAWRVRMASPRSRR